MRHLALIALLLAGCAGVPTIPAPPGLLGAPSVAITEFKGARMQVTKCQSADLPKTVATFYQDQLNSRHGWRTLHRDDESASFSTGNIKQLNLDGFEPEDPKKTGHGVFIMPGSKGGSLIYVVNVEPN